MLLGTGRPIGVVERRYYCCGEQGYYWCRGMTGVGDRGFN